MVRSDATTLEVAGHPVTVTHPDKPVFPATDIRPAVTKIDLEHLPVDARHVAGGVDRRLQPLETAGQVLSRVEW